MMCEVQIDDEGAVTVIVHSGEDDDETTRVLAGLSLEDMLDRASHTAVDTWTKLRTEDADAEPVDEAGE